jgi:acyl-coenzyme A synthetase/AMP-(fatty) acid ligase
LTLSTKVVHLSFHQLRDFWLSSKQQGDKPYLVYANERLTYNRAHQVAENLARKLYHDHGVRKGDRIGIAARNLPEWVTLWWAAQMLGAIICAVNAWLPSEPLVYCLSNTNCKVIIVDEDRLKRLEAHYQTLAERGMQLLLVLRPKSKHASAISFDDWSRSQHSTPLPEFDIKPDDWCCVYFTSGTTGLPKGVIHTNRQLLTNFLNTQVGMSHCKSRLLADPC